MNSGPNNFSSFYNGTNRSQEEPQPILETKPTQPANPERTYTIGGESFEETVKKLQERGEKTLDAEEAAKEKESGNLFAVVELSSGERKVIPQNILDKILKLAETEQQNRERREVEDLVSEALEASAPTRSEEEAVKERQREEHFSKILDSQKSPDTPEPMIARTEAPGDSELVNPEDTGNRAKLNERFKKFIKKYSTPIAIAITAATILLGTKAMNSKDGNTTNTESSKSNIETTDSNSESDQATNDGENKEDTDLEVTYRGQFASEDGTTYNANKSSDHAFGESLKSGASEEEMKEDLINRQNQNGQLAATYFYMQEKTTDPSFGVEGAKFNNPDDLLEAMEANPDLRQRVYDYTKDTFANNSLTEDEVKGKFHNFFLDSDFETGDVDTSNVDVVGCTTNEDGTKVYKISREWTDADGNIHVDTFTFKVKCGGQPLDQIDFTTSVRQIPPEDPTTPIAPTPTDKPEPTTTPTPIVTVTPEPTTTPTPSVKPKDANNNNRIVGADNKNVAKDTNSGSLVVTPNPEVKPQDKTNDSKNSDYGGTSAKIVKNDSSQQKEKVQDKTKTDYSENRGGANASNAAENPVQANTQAQNAANTAEIPTGQAPSASDVGGQQLEDYLAGLGL